MMDFDRWFKEQAPAAAPEAELPEGLWLQDGTLMYRCRGCDSNREWCGEIEEFVDRLDRCGGSPWCLP